MPCLKFADILASCFAWADFGVNSFVLSSSVLLTLGLHIVYFLQRLKHVDSTARISDWLSCLDCTRRGFFCKVKIALFPLLWLLPATEYLWETGAVKISFNQCQRSGAVGKPSLIWHASKPVRAEETWSNLLYTQLGPSTWCSLPSKLTYHCFHVSRTQFSPSLILYIDGLKVTDFRCNQI